MKQIHFEIIETSFIWYTNPEASDGNTLWYFCENEIFPNQDFINFFHIGSLEGYLPNASAYEVSVFEGLA